MCIWLAPRTSWTTVAFVMHRINTSWPGAWNFPTLNSSPSCRTETSLTVWSRNYSTGMINLQKKLDVERQVRVCLFRIQGNWLHGFSSLCAGSFFWTYIPQKVLKMFLAQGLWKFRYKIWESMQCDGPYVTFLYIYTCKIWWQTEFLFMNEFMCIKMSRMVHHNAGHDCNLLWHAMIPMVNDIEM